MRVLLLLALLCFAFPAFAQEADTTFDPGYAGFSVKVKGLENRYKVFGLYILPNEEITLKASTPVTVTTDAGHLQKKEGSHWTWKAPSNSGLVPLNLKAGSGDMTLNIFVMRPASDVKNSKLDEYRMGQYPSKPFKGLATYQAPNGFVEVTPDNQNTKISPHFTLGQFLCKQPSASGKKFIVLRPELLLKLERILQQVNKEGFRTDSFFIMSGYRTPFYNKAIGNKQYSRHIYGGAADFYIDVVPKDGAMDDLNKDGKIDRRDAAILYDLIERLSKQEGWRHVGGLGEYGVSHIHGPFVHVDSRGYRARWGKS